MSAIKVRRLRRHTGMSQAAMAALLDISPSYLNLIEHGHRPLTRRLAERLRDDFGFDPAAGPDDALGGAAGLLARLADPRFADLNIGAGEVAEWLSAAPLGALAFARAFDEAGAAVGPSAQVRLEIDRHTNHFPALDRAAEALAAQCGDPDANLAGALARRLAQVHGLTLRTLPASAMGGALRRYDPAQRTVDLAELLPAPARQFQLATQVVLLELGPQIAALANLAPFAERAAWRLYRRHLAAYAAAALVMPYARFHRAAQATRHDLAVLQARFAVSFAQAAQRLTTLQRPDQPGLPFFMARLDRAGQFSSALAGASNTPLLGGGSCPRWAPYLAFAQPGQTVRQLAEVERQLWLTLARADPADVHDGPECATVLGLSARAAAGQVIAEGLDLAGAATPIGAGCAACRQPDCRQRAAPPVGLALRFDERVHRAVPYDFGMVAPVAV